MSTSEYLSHIPETPPVLDLAQLEAVGHIRGQIAETRVENGVATHTEDVMGITSTGTFVSVDRAVGEPDATQQDYFVVRWGDPSEGLEGLKQAKLAAVSPTTEWDRSGGVFLSNHPDLPFRTVDYGDGGYDVPGAIAIPGPAARQRGTLPSFMVDDSTSYKIFSFGEDGQPRAEQVQPLPPSRFQRRVGGGIGQLITPEPR